MKINQIDSEQFEKILRYIRSGVESGATLQTGGDRFGSKGFYIKPTVFSDVKVFYIGLVSSIDFRPNIHLKKKNFHFFRTTC